MSMLAEIRHRRGETEAAKQLLIDCMQKLVAEFRESKYRSDQELFAGDFRHHRATYLRLFPDGEAELSKQGLQSISR